MTGWVHGYSRKSEKYLDKPFPKWNYITAVIRGQIVFLKDERSQDWGFILDEFCDAAYDTVYGDKIRTIVDDALFK